jgi:hypothetical protein
LAPLLTVVVRSEGHAMGTTVERWTTAEAPPSPAAGRWHAAHDLLPRRALMVDRASCVFEPTGARAHVISWNRERNCRALRARHGGGTRR